MNVLVTGGAGFIGSNFISLFLSLNPTYNVINMDALTYASDLNNLNELEGNKRYSFIKGSICDADLVDNIFNKFGITSIVHFAAESHVDNSIANPSNFIETNINGTFILLEAAKNNWLDKNNLPRKGYEKSRFHHISTDEVYGSLGNEGYFSENTPYAPNSPYSASKAASDFLVRSYHHTYGLNVVTTNCSNNFGPKQHNEKLIPTIIRKAISDEDIPIYGTGTNVRDWLFVEDHCKAINLIFDKGKTGETYLIGGNNEQTNLDIANKICSLLDDIYPKENGTYKNQITFVTDRLGHDYRYAIDATKLKEELNWIPEQSFDEGLRKTVEWYIEKYKNQEI